MTYGQASGNQDFNANCLKIHSYKQPVDALNNIPIYGFYLFERLDGYPC